MKPFNSFLSKQLNQYLAYRHELGFTDRTLRCHLRIFDQYMMDHPCDEKAFDPRYFLAMRENLKTKPKSINETLRSIRGFFQFLVRQGLYEHNPLTDIPPFPQQAYVPFIFSPQTTERLLQAIEHNRRYTPRYFLIDSALYLGILLIARCGLRISEPVRLLCSHYREREGSIYIEKTKFHKDRLIPLPKSLVGYVNQFLALRRSFAITSPYLLADSKRSLSAQQLRRVFNQGIKDIGLNQAKITLANTTFGAPTPHSLRHSFAVNTLKQIKARGQSPQAALPVLSAYLGHRKYRYTAVYLKVLDAQQRQALVDFSIARQDEL